MSTAHATNDQMRQAVERYLAAVATGTGDEIAALYAVDATLEDPAGSDPVRGRAAISAFYRAIESFERETDLLALRMSNGTAAVHFRVAVRTPARTIITTPIDIFTVDADGAITSMRAIWSVEDVETKEIS